MTVFRYISIVGQHLMAQTATKAEKLFKHTSPLPSCASLNIATCGHFLAGALNQVALDLYSLLFG